MCDRNEVLTEIAITELTITRPPDREIALHERPSPLVADQTAYCDATERSSEERRAAHMRDPLHRDREGSPLIFAKWVNRTLVKRGAGMP